MNDIGEHCIECGCSVAWGSGNYVNRIGAWDETKDGWLCHECQLIECDECGEKTDDYELINGDCICADCSRSNMLEEYKTNEANNHHTENLLLLAESFGTSQEVEACEKTLEAKQNNNTSEPPLDEQMTRKINDYYKQLIQ
jgi:hypothetical protein